MSEQVLKTPLPTEKALPVADKLLRGIVAPGRTIVKPDPLRRNVVGHKEDGTPILQAVRAEFGPGKEVELSEPEMTYYKALGFIVDPDRKATQFEGSTVTHP